MNIFEDSRFAVNPNVSIQRSKFNRPQDVKFTFNAGEVIPFYVDEVLPGDTHSIDLSFVARMQTPITPFMDNIELQFMFFFVANRIIHTHFVNIMGENSESAWYPDTEYMVPQITAPEGGWSKGTIADYLGVPTGVEGLSVNAYPFRAYAKICDDWLRSEALQDPLNIPLTDSTVVGSNGSNFVTDVAKGGKPYIANKYFDYFTGALPAPQRGPSVPLPVASSSTESVPVFGNGYGLGLRGSTTAATTYGQGTFLGVNSSAIGYSSNEFVELGNARTASNFRSATPVGVVRKSDVSNPAYSGLVADVSGIGITVGTINELRLAFQLQKLFEKDARGGGRYISVLLTHFGVESPDARLQRPEFLGGFSCPIRVSQVAQTSESANTPQGNVAAFSLTSDSRSLFTKSFTEHGFIIGVCVARYKHTYQQGLERFWSRKTRFDYYWPVFANIGEQAILNKEIYATGTSADDEVFGYQEAWADYRYKPSRVAGEMRSNVQTSLDMWHLADDYASQPYLSDSWLREDKSNVDRVLAVTSAVSDQFLADVLVSNKTVRPMPMYSIPGLIDHH